MKTNPSAFRNPHSRRNRLFRLLWTVVWALLFRPTPWFMGAWRSLLLRLFGAKIGFVRLRSTVRVWAPWLLEIGDDVYIDHRVNLYNPFGIRIGSRVVISQGAFLCTATHDYRDPEFPLTGSPIVIGDDTWIAAEAFVAPGVTIGAGAVVAARACVVKDIEPWSVVGGNPARYIKPRTLDSAADTEASPERRPEADA